MDSMTAPVPTAASHCSQGGSQVLMAILLPTANDGGRGDRQQGQHTTCPQPHEPLLMGWSTGEAMIIMETTTAPYNSNRRENFILLLSSVFHILVV
jgi:hypothetical protein